MKAVQGFPQSQHHCITSQVGSLPALSTFDNLIHCSPGKIIPVPKYVAAKGFRGFTEIHLLQKCVGIQLDPVKPYLGDTLPINSYILVEFAMIIVD